MSYQQTFDFVSRPQNSADNQAILDGNIDRLNKQCRILLQALQDGKKLTVRDAMMDYGIGDPRARFRDLVKAGYDIQKELIEGRFKKYWLKL